MNILVLDDQPNSTDLLKKMLLEIAPDKKIVGSCQTIEQAVKWLNEHEYPDLSISNVQLPDGLSFNIFRSLERKIPVIYMCAFDKYALDAFKVQGLHYLLKPVKQNELKDAIERYNVFFRTKNNEAQQKQQLQNVPTLKKYQERFIINTGSQMKLVFDHEIAYIFIENKAVFITTFENQKFLTDISLENFEAKLNPQLFFRINRQLIVNLKAIRKMAPASKQRIKLNLNPVSSFETITSFERTPDFKKWLLGEQ